MPPCEGIYADITHEHVETIDIDTPGMKSVMIAYENYKKQYLREFAVPHAISGNYVR